MPDPLVVLSEKERLDILEPRVDNLTKRVNDVEITQEKIQSVWSKVNAWLTPYYPMLKIIFVGMVMALAGYFGKQVLTPTPDNPNNPNNPNIVIPDKQKKVATFLLLRYDVKTVIDPDVQKILDDNGILSKIETYIEGSTYKFQNSYISFPCIVLKNFQGTDIDVTKLGTTQETISFINKSLK